jgi:hypothetical protein
MEHIGQPRALRPGPASLFVLATVCMTLVAAGCDDTSPPRPEPAVEGTPVPAIRQAKWRIKTHPSAALGKVTREERHRIRAEKPKLKRLVRDVYNVLFLSTEEKRKILRERFTRGAAAALLRSGVGIPQRISGVKTTMRRARIGIAAASARLAAAEVWLRARALDEGGKVRIVHRSTLWLEKSKGQWRAIAFEVSQGPAA